MTAQPMAAAKHPMTVGKRLYRGLFFAILVAIVGAGSAVIPALFVQSAFTGSLEYCSQQQQSDLNLYGEVRTTCEQDIQDEPKWLPVALIAAGATVGLLGGFGYGFVSPRSGAPRDGETPRSWLPF